MRYLTVIYDPAAVSAPASQPGCWIVVSDQGAVYLWRPQVLPFARQAFPVLSANRHRVSKWLRLLSDGELEAELRNTHAPKFYGTDPQTAY